MQRILVLGGGFAGLWSALGAARRLDQLGVGPDSVEVLLVNRTPWHSIRVRNYEADLGPTLVRLSDVLDPVDVRRLEGEVTRIDCTARTATCSVAGTSRVLSYDRLILALGSRLVRPPIPGLSEHAFDVDTYEAAARLNRHVAGLPSRASSPGQFTVLVIGAGLTGIEVATEMPGKLAAAIAAAPAARSAPAPRVILADRNAWIGSDMGDGARPVIAEALCSLGIETRPGISVTSVDEDGATLAAGERIAASTIVWCAGMQANPLTQSLPVDRDRLGRLAVDACLKVKGLDAVFAAGDMAWFPIDGKHSNVMSCQHGRPMGRFAGYNAASDLLGQPMLPLEIDWYTTILDLGPWGAVYTNGWDRRVIAEGASAKRTKRIINGERIYPPRDGDRRAIFDAAAPVVQAPPEVSAQGVAA